MSHYIPRLARISSGKGAGAKRKAPRDDPPDEAALDVGRLSRLVPKIRRRLAVDRQLSDAALLASLVSIARHPTHQARWRAAESSTLGRHLANRSQDLHHTLVTLLSLLPKP